MTTAALVGVVIGAACVTSFLLGIGLDSFHEKARARVREAEYQVAMRAARQVIREHQDTIRELTPKENS